MIERYWFWLRVYQAGYWLQLGGQRTARAATRVGIALAAAGIARLRHDARWYADEREGGERLGWAACPECGRRWLVFLAPGEPGDDLGCTCLGSEARVVRYIDPPSRAQLRVWPPAARASYLAALRGEG